MAIELTLLLIAAAAMVFVLMRNRRQASVDKAAEAARRAVEAQVAQNARKDR